MEGQILANNDQNCFFSVILILVKVKNPWPSKAIKQKKNCPRESLKIGFTLVRGSGQKSAQAYLSN